MTYKTFGEFKVDYDSAWAALRRQAGDNNATKQIDADVAWKLYQMSRNPALGFHVFGRHVTGEKAKELQNFRQKKGLTAKLPKHMQGITKSPVDKYQKNFGYVNDVEDGSILMMGGGKWSLTVNDAWLLGGVHSRLPFYAASTITKDNIFDKNYVLSITGRELLGLAAFGYREVHGHPDLGVVFVSGSAPMADGAALSLYQQVAGQLTTVDRAKKFFKDNGFKIH
jgi:hypothetical protein